MTRLPEVCGMSYRLLFSSGYQAVLDELSGKVGKPVSIGQFLRMAVGEGVER